MLLLAADAIGSLLYHSPRVGTKMSPVPSVAPRKI
jgi:hypothetical protein